MTIPWDRIELNDPYYGKTIWPAMGWIRGLADWHVRWEYMTLPGDGPDYIVDVGAGAGAFALVCHHLWPESKILCFEPCYDVLPYLAYNVSQIENIKILPIAASDTNDAKPIFTNPAAALWGREVMAPSMHGSGEPRAEIQCVRLDDVIDHPVHVMKLDVEAHEVQCLRGAERILETYHPDLIVERKEPLQNTVHDPHAMILEMGYALIGSTGQDYWYAEAS